MWIHEVGMEMRQVKMRFEIIREQDHEMKYDGIKI